MNDNWPGKKKVGEILLTPLAQPAYLSVPHFSVGISGAERGLFWRWQGLAVAPLPIADDQSIALQSIDFHFTGANTKGGLHFQL